MADKKRYIPADQAPQALAPTDELVQGQLQQILESPEFHATRQQREFLQFGIVLPTRMFQHGQVIPCRLLLFPCTCRQAF